MNKLFRVIALILLSWSRQSFSETKSLIIATNYIPMPDTAVVHYNPKITTNEELFIQISDATGIPPQEMLVDLGAGIYLKQNKELVEKTTFFMLDKNGKTMVVASVKF